jgi:glycosyltransferase involved in cell wall biosynthesis
VITRLNRGGPARTLLSVEPLLRERGVESLLLVGEPASGEQDLAAQFAARGVRVHRIDGLRRELRPFADASVRRRLARALDEFAPDVVHTHTFKAGWLGRTAALRRPVKRVHTFHGHLFRGAFPGPAGELLAAVERRLARRTDLVIAVSENVRSDLCERWRVVPRERTAVLPGVLLPELAAPPTESERAAARARTLPAVGPWLGTLARLTKVKAPLFLLDVAERVLATRPDARFVWVGDGDLRERFLAAVARRRLSESVRFVGWQSDVRPWHLALDVELLLSDQEGLPLSLLEARALGVPIVATAVGGVSEVVRDGVDGRLVPPRDAGAAARAILETLARPAMRAGGDAIEDMAVEFSPESHAKRLIELYERVMRTPAAAA